MQVPSSAQAAPRDPVLRGQKHCDVAIVGAGLTGVTLAWMLTRRGVSVSLLEAGEPGCGATAGCTGKVTAPLNIKSRRDIRKFIEDLKASKSSLLSNTTSGYHFHTIEAESEDILDEIEEALKEKHFLVDFLDYETTFKQ